MITVENLAASIEWLDDTWGKFRHDGKTYLLTRFLPFQGAAPQRSLYVVWDLTRKPVSIAARKTLQATLGDFLSAAWPVPVAS